MSGTTGNRCSGGLSVVVADVVRQQWADGHVQPEEGWEPADVLRLAAEACRDRGIVGAPVQVTRVAAAESQ